MPYSRISRYLKFYFALARDTAMVSMGPEGPIMRYLCIAWSPFGCYN